MSTCQWSTQCTLGAATCPPLIYIKYKIQVWKLQRALHTNFKPFWAFIRSAFRISLCVSDWKLQTEALAPQIKYKNFNISLDLTDFKLLSRISICLFNTTAEYFKLIWDLELNSFKCLACNQERDLKIWVMRNQFDFITWANLIIIVGHYLGDLLRFLVHKKTNNVRRHHILNKLHFKIITYHLN